MNPNEILTTNIRRLIRDSGFKQKAVASKAGYGQNEFSAMLHGRKLIKAEDIPRISAALEVEPNALFQQFPMQSA